MLSSLDYSVIFGSVMKFKIVAVGKIKESFFRDAIAEYVKRLSKYAVVEVSEVAECSFNGEPTGKEIDKIINVEGQAILQRTEGCVIAMDINGKAVDSVELSDLIKNQKLTNSTFTFVIGGSYGLSQAVKDKANFKLSFGKITLPHQLFRVVLCEQLYRACCIEHNSRYHK